jgi:hypothetical protein
MFFKLFCKFWIGYKTFIGQCFQESNNKLLLLAVHGNSRMIVLFQLWIQVQIIFYMIRVEISTASRV